MDIMRAKELLALLADGVNPITGEVLTDEDSCNQVEIVRALHKVLRLLDDMQNRPTRSSLENAGKPWTQEDEALLCSLFDAGGTRKEISRQLKRTGGSISARLEKLGKINQKEIVR